MSICAVVIAEVRGEGGVAELTIIGDTTNERVGIEGYEGYAINESEPEHCAGIVVSTTTHHGEVV